MYAASLTLVELRLLSYRLTESLQAMWMERKANEEFVRDLLVALQNLRCLAFLCGDLNDTVKDSPSLSLANTRGVFHLKPSGASTKKKRSTSMNEAIDHVFSNKAALDMGPKVVFDPAIDLSDHIPLRISLKLMQPDFEVVKWPATLKDIPKTLSKVVPWQSEPRTFQEWQSSTIEWLEEATGCHIPDKSQWTIEKFRSPSPQPCQLFCRLMRISRALTELIKFGPTRQRVSALKRKVVAAKKKRWRDQILP